VVDGKSVVDKETAVPVHAMNAYGMSSGIVPLILNLCTRWKWVMGFRLRPLYPCEKTRYPFNWRQDGPRIVWTLGRRAQFLSASRIRTSDGLEPNHISL